MLIVTGLVVALLGATFSGIPAFKFNLGMLFVCLLLDLVLTSLSNASNECGEGPLRYLACIAEIAFWTFTWFLLASGLTWCFS